MLTGRRVAHHDGARMARRDTTTKGSTMNDEKNETPQGFVNLLRMLDQGTVEADCGDALRKLIQELSAYSLHFNKAKGTLTIKLSLAVEAGGIVDVRADIAHKAPKVTRPKTTAWITPEGELSAKNPKQLEFGAVKLVGAAPVRKDVAK